MKFRKYAGILPALVLLSGVSVNAAAAVFTYEGEVTDATGAFATLIGPGTSVDGAIDITSPGAGGTAGIGDFNSIGVQVGGFCFIFGGGTCAGGAAVEITSIDSAAVEFDGSAFPSGGSFDVTAFSTTFGLSIPISFDLSAGTFSASAAGLGSADGSGGFVGGPGPGPGPGPVIPIPAAAWLFGSALLGLVGIRRRRT